MRRPTRLLAPVLALAVASCASGPAPLTPLPDDGREDTLGITIASAKQTVIDLLHAYAEVPQDGGEALEDAVGSVPLAEWAHWEGVAFETRGEGVTSIVRIEQISPLDSGASEQGTLQVTFSLRAQVHMIHLAGDGRTSRTVHDFTGLATVVQQGSGVAPWAITDLSVDGVPLSRSVVRLEGSRRAGAVTVDLPSAFERGYAGLTFNLRITNGTDETVVIVPSRTGMRLDGTFIVSNRAGPFAPVPPGEALELQVFFDRTEPAWTTSQRGVLEIGLAGWPGARTMRFAVFGPAEPTPEPTGSPGTGAPTASPAGSPSPGATSEAPATEPATPAEPTAGGTPAG